MKKLIFIALLPLLLAACEPSGKDVKTKTLAGHKWVWTESRAALEYGLVTPDTAGITCSLELNADGTYTAEVSGELDSTRDILYYWRIEYESLFVDGEMIKPSGTYTTGSAPCDTNRCKVHMDNPEAYTVDSIVFYNPVLDDTTVYFYKLRDGRLSFSHCYHSAYGCWYHIFEVFE